MDYREKSRLLSEKRERARRITNDLSEKEGNELIKLDAELKRVDENKGVWYRPVGDYYKKMTNGE